MLEGITRPLWNPGFARTEVGPCGCGRGCGGLVVIVCYAEAPQFVRSDTAHLYEHLTAEEAVDVVSVAVYTVAE